MFAAVCVLFAVQGHAMTSGVEVPWWAPVAGAVVAGGAVWGLTGRERGLLAVASVAVATQVGLHALFSLAQAVVRPEPTAGASLAHRWVSYLLCSPPGGAAHSHGGAATAHVMSATHAMDAMSGMDAMSTTHAMHGMNSAAHAGVVVPDGMSPMTMLAAHLANALLCGLWLAHGERATFRILRVLAGWLVAPLRLLLRLPAPAHRTRVRARGNHSPHALRQLLLVHAITSRGPPVGTAVL